MLFWRLFWLLKERLSMIYVVKFVLLAAPKVTKTLDRRLSHISVWLDFQYNSIGYKKLYLYLRQQYILRHWDFSVSQPKCLRSFVSGVQFSVPDFSMHFFPVLCIEISVSHSQSASGALWAGCRSPYRTFRCIFSPFCALRFQCFTTKVPQELCGWGAVLRTGLLNAQNG